MATMNILQANIRGTIGAETGCRVKGKNVLKKRIWSKTPNNEVQEGSVRAFECLNRLSSSIAKKYWNWMGLKQGNMNKHNVIAHEFRAIVREHKFQPSNLSERIPLGDAIKVNAFSVDMTTSTVTVDLIALLSGIVAGKQSAVVVVCDGTGHVHLCEQLKSQVFSAKFESALLAKFPYYLIAFSSTREGNKIRLGNLVVKMTLPENIFYTENYDKIRWWTVEPNYLYGEGDGLTTSGETLVVDGTIG